MFMPGRDDSLYAQSSFAYDKAVGAIRNGSDLALQESRVDPDMMMMMMNRQPTSTAMMEYYHPQQEMRYRKNISSNNGKAKECVVQ